MPRPTHKGAPVSVRFTHATERLVEDEARRTARSRSAVVEAFTEEAARARRFPGIAFRGEDARRRAWVIGSGLDIWEIAQMLEEFGSAERLAEESQLDRRQLQLAQAYRAEFPDEIAAAVAENRRPVEELQSLYPFVELASDER
jgi:hypothetical protein